MSRLVTTLALMAAKRRKKKPTPGQFPSETYSARAKRDRPIVSMSMARSTLEALDALATEAGVTRSSMVEIMTLERAKKKG